MIFMIILSIAGLGVLIFALIALCCLPMIWCVINSDEEPTGETNYYAVLLRAYLTARDSEPQQPEQPATEENKEEKKEGDATAEGDKKPDEGAAAEEPKNDAEGGDEEATPMIVKKKK